ncbi:MAG TPA: carboxymuconolactone decarboxylase family protein, partial [Burkholderiales bacterium]|nr:carboxymuconolactone decarboxylase family protein [Burkholderiales bacterium]
MKKAKKSKSNRDYDARFERGMDVLRKMGRENLMTNQKALYPEMYEMSVGHLFGDVWGRPGLSLRERQLVTLAANIALCRPSGNHSHYLSAMHLGITKEEICEV